MSSKVLLISILMIVLPVCYVHFYSNNVISDYVIYCNRGVLIFRKPNVDVLISDIENQCNNVKIDQYNMGDIIDTEVNKQFTHNKNITGKCLSCGQSVSDERRWCSPDCRDNYEKIK